MVDFSQLNVIVPSLLIGLHEAKYDGGKEEEAQHQQKEEPCSILLSRLCFMCWFTNEWCTTQTSYSPSTYPTEVV
jgi:hypothetical protein